MIDVDLLRGIYYMEKYLHFRVSTSLKSLLGQRLVTDQIAAIFELVKNSYDADASYVSMTFDKLGTSEATITIKDDGTGMSLDDIQNKWMVIATDSKKNELYSPIYKRVLNGDKGIGRFSSDRLGSKLRLLSSSAETREYITAEFNWDEFDENYADVSEVDIPFELKGVTDGKYGVTLIISGLRDEWTKDDINSLIKQLRQLKSPFAEKDDFNIYIDAKELGIHDYTIVPEKIENVSSLWIEVETAEDTPGVVNAHIVKDGMDYYENFLNLYNIYPIKVRIYFFNQGDKVRFKNRYSVRVRDFGNIRLYRDDFRIHPYGDEKNDWLDIDRRHAQGFARTFSSRDIIGYVQTYKDKNTTLIPLTNRQGLVENEAFFNLKQYIIEFGVRTLEKYYFQKFKKGKNETLEKSKKEIDQSIQDIKRLSKQILTTDPVLGKALENHIKNIEKQHVRQIQYAKDQQEITRVYSRIAQRETFLHQLIHQAMLDLKNAIGAVSILFDIGGFNITEETSVYYSNLNNNLHNAFAKMITIRDDVSRTRKKVKLNIGEEVCRTVNAFKAQFDENNINVNVNVQKEIFMLMDIQDFRTILTNLFSNAIKSLREVHDRERTLSVTAKKNANNIVIQIVDNGVGIDENNRERIFDPFFTTTEEQGGLGLGLTIVDEILKEYNGVLELADVVNEGACFNVYLRS